MSQTRESSPALATAAEPSAGQGSAAVEAGPLHLPAGLHYECVRCGNSCGEFWEIPVEPAMVDSIRQRPTAKLVGEAAPAVQPDDPPRRVQDSVWTPGGHAMRLDGCGHCVMQTRAGLCSLHLAFGYDSKPNICRSFPYKFVETPQGIFPGLSFACTAVLANQGPPLAEQRGEIEDLLGWTHSRKRVDVLNGLALDIPLSWAQYEELEADLTELLDARFGPLGRRLLAQGAYLTLLTKFLREARVLAGNLTGGAAVHQGPFEHFRRKMRGGDGGWPRLFAFADKRGGSQLVRRMFLGFAHALRNTHGQQRGRLGSYAMVVGLYLRHAIGRGRLQLPTMPRAVAWSELCAVEFDPQRPEFEELLARYFRHRLFRKDLLTAENVQSGHQLMLMHWGLLHWYAAALAAAAGSPTVELDHLREGLRNVEKFYVFHSNFDALFSRYPMLRGFLDRLMGHPLYSYSMAYGEWLN